MLTPPILITLLSYWALCVLVGAWVSKKAGRGS